MKKVVALLGVMLFSVAAFALNAVAQGGEGCEERRAAFEKDLKTMRYQPAGIIHYVLVEMADPMGALSDEKAQADAVCYATFHVQGVTLVDYIRANADAFRQRVSAEERGAKGLDQLKSQALGFANRVERLAEQVAINNVAAYDNEDWVVQHVLSNLADPMRQLSDEEAAPKAHVYKQLKVGQRPLMSFVRQQATRFEPLNVAKDLAAFADRVDRLAK